MAMPNWLIPSGEVLFSGNEQQLHAAVGSLSGKLREGGRFTCCLGGGAVTFRFKMQTLFRCAYAKAPGGYKITWQAYPALSAGLLLAALLLIALAGLFAGKLELAGWTACLLSLLVCLYVIQRSSCVEQFTEKFGK